MRFRLLTLAPALFFAICLDARAADAIISQQINFPGSNSLLSGTLTLPAGIAFQVPGVVLIQGSGPTDRDGNQPPVIRTDLLRQLADALARKGIASLRYDKRGMHANAMARPQAEADYASFFRWENFVADAAGAYRFLQRQGPVDPGKVAILGHSEGGLIALAAATSLQADGAAPPALILAATPGRRMDVILREQLERLLAEQHATPSNAVIFSPPIPASPAPSVTPALCRKQCRQGLPASIRPISASSGNRCWRWTLPQCPAPIRVLS